jgi:Tol biopolymer transport system component
LVWVDRAGRTTAVTDSVEMYQTQLRLSPDGNRLAVEIETPEGDDDIWILDLERGTRVRLTDEGRNNRPVWSPDGTRIAFSSDRSDGGSLYWRNSNGSGEATLLLSREREQYPESWSPDGRAISFLEAPAYGRTRDVWILPLEGEPFAFTKTASYERQAAFSPDGHWLAYVSDESGKDEVYLQA